MVFDMLPLSAGWVRSASNISLSILYWSCTHPVLISCWSCGLHGEWVRVKNGPGRCTDPVSNLQPKGCSWGAPPPQPLPHKRGGAFQCLLRSTCWKGRWDILILPRGVGWSRTPQSGSPRRRVSRL